MKQEPYYYSTRFFDVVYHGGKQTEKCSRSKKRERTNQDEVLMKQSQKKLCIMLDSIPEFRCRYRIVLRANYIEDMRRNKVAMEIFVRYLSKPEFNRGNKRPLFFWKKRYFEEFFEYELLTNARFSFSPENLANVIRYLWRKYYGSDAAMIERVNFAEEPEVMRKFALSLNDGVPSEKVKTGERRWGIINRSNYTVVKPEKKYVSLREIIEIESKAQSRSFTKTVFIKEGDSTKK